MTPSESLIENFAKEIHRYRAKAAPSVPCNPTCDGCWHLFCGTMTCSQCESAFYCCRDCQVSHWKSKHKDECAVLQRLNEAKAKKVLGTFFEHRNSWKLLDKTGAYNAAVRQGLHGKIREALELDRDTLHDRYRAGQNVRCYTHRVMCEIFRPNGADGNDRTDWGIDGHRIKAYVTSHPDALLPWFHASTQLLMALLDREVANNSAALSSLTTVATEVWDGWVDVFTSPVASRAILLPLPTPRLKSNDGNSSNSTAATSETKTGKHEMAERKRHARVDHATKIILIFLDAMNRKRTREEPDPHVWSSFLLVAAMVHMRLLDYGVKVNAAEMFNLNGKDRNLFQNLFVPVAKATIAKGCELSQFEMTAIVERFPRSVQRN